MNPDQELSVACGRGNLQLAEELIKAGARPTKYCFDKIVRFGATDIETAIRLVESLMHLYDGSLGQLCRHPDPLVSAPLTDLLIKNGGKLSTYKLRSVAGAKEFNRLDPDHKEMGPRVAGMLFAARNGDIAMVREIGPIDDIRDAFAWAARNGHLRILKQLICQCSTDRQILNCDPTSGIVDVPRAIKLATRYRDRNNAPRYDVLQYLTGYVLSMRNLPAVG